MGKDTGKKATPKAQLEVQVVDAQGKGVETLALDEGLWSGRVNVELLNQAVRMYRASARGGRASTKRRGEVSGGGKKPWKQKHTGRARAGSIRSPLWRGGGIVFGPRPRSFGYRLPQKMRTAALRESLKGKLQDKELVVVNDLTATEIKTRAFAGLGKALGIERRAVIVREDFPEPLRKSLRNLAWCELCRADDLNAFDVLNTHKVVLTKRAFQQVEGRVRGRAKG